MTSLVYVNGVGTADTEISDIKHVDMSSEDLDYVQNYDFVTASRYLREMCDDPAKHKWYSVKSLFFYAVWTACFAIPGVKTIPTEITHYMDLVAPFLFLVCPLLICTVFLNRMLRKRYRMKFCQRNLNYVGLVWDIYEERKGANLEVWTIIRLQCRGEWYEMGILTDEFDWRVGDLVQFCVDDKTGKVYISYNVVTARYSHFDQDIYCVR